MDDRRVLTWAEARALGVTSAQLHHRVRTGRWQRPYPRVYVTYAGQLTDEDKLKAALAYAGTGAVLSHGTAANRYGFGKPTKLVHVTVAEGRRVRPQPGLVVHRSGRWGAHDVELALGLLCTSPTRTVIDLVAAAKTPGTAAAIVLDAIGGRHTTADLVRALASSWDRFPYRGEILEVVAEAAEGTHSTLELRHVRVCRNHGLPVGTRQKRENVGGKEVAYDDVLEGYEIYSELDGREVHERAKSRFRDANRDNVNNLRGRLVLRFGWVQMLDEPCQIAEPALHRAQVTRLARGAAPVRANLLRPAARPVNPQGIWAPRMVRVLGRYRPR